jgi:hypothetical protein
MPIWQILPRRPPEMNADEPAQARGKVKEKLQERTPGQDGRFYPDVLDNRVMI